MRFQVFPSLWSVSSGLCIDKTPEVAKNKVSKPKRYSLSKLRFCPAPLKRLMQTRPHMSTSLCGNICIMQPKCSRKERGRGFSNCSSVEAAMTGRRCMFLGKSKSTLFGLQKVMHLGIIKITYNRTITHFMDDSFVNLGDEVIHAMWAITTDSKVCYIWLC